MVGKDRGRGTYLGRLPRGGLPRGLGRSAGLGLQLGQQAKAPQQVSGSLEDHIEVYRL